MSNNTHIYFNIGKAEENKQEAKRKVLTRAILGNWTFSNNVVNGTDLFIKTKTGPAVSVSMKNVSNIINTSGIRSILRGNPPGGGVGATGPSGVQGPTGVGGAGATGVMGPTGIRGATGPTGVAGVGSFGTTGVSGATGAQGAIGAAGPTGVTGATGAKGTIGQPGYPAIYMSSLSTNYLQVSSISISTIISLGVVENSLSLSSLAQTFIKPVAKIGPSVNINLVGSNLSIANTSNSVVFNNSLITTLNDLGSYSRPFGIIATSYIYNNYDNIVPPDGAISVKITVIGGGGDGAGNTGTTSGGAGGGAGGTVIYTTFINNCDISHLMMSTIGNYSACVVSLNNTINLFAFYGGNAGLDNREDVGLGRGAYGPNGSIVIPGMNGYSGGNSGCNGSGFLGGIYPSGGLSGGGGMGGGPYGGYGGDGRTGGGFGSSGVEGGFGSGGGGGTKETSGGVGGSPLIIFEWM